MYLRVVPHVARFEVEPGRVELVRACKVRHAHPKMPKFVHRGWACSKYQHGFLLASAWKGNARSMGFRTWLESLSAITRSILLCRLQSTSQYK